MRLISWLLSSFNVLSASKCPVSFNTPGTFTAVQVYPRTACRVPQASAAARSVPLANPSPKSGSCKDPHFILPHVLWLCNIWEQTGIGAPGPCHSLPCLFTASSALITAPLKHRPIKKKNPTFLTETTFIPGCASEGSGNLLCLFLERKLCTTLSS